MNLNASEFVYEQECKYEYSHKCWFQFDCEYEWEFNNVCKSKYKFEWNFVFKYE